MKFLNDVILMRNPAERRRVVRTPCPRKRNADVVVTAQMAEALQDGGINGHSELMRELSGILGNL